MTRLILRSLLRIERLLTFLVLDTEMKRRGGVNEDNIRNLESLRDERHADEKKMVEDSPTNGRYL